MSHLKLGTGALTLALGLCGVQAQAQSLDLSYLRGLLDATPAGGWVQANTTSWSSAWATGASAVPETGFGYTPNIVYAWSSMAWDSTRGDLLLWGGGHASYSGNEMYVWQGSTGTWTRGSLPSRMVYPTGAIDSRSRVAVDGAAPQSAHTYESNVYLPQNDMFMTFGGPTFNDANMFRSVDANGNLVPAGPWLWDPRKADPNKVGGTNGSGYDTSVAGGNMWTNMGGGWASTGVNFINNSTAYRNENGKDVVYVTVKPGSWGNLYRYTPGDVRSGNPTDSFELVGVNSFQAASNESSGTIDDRHGLYINTAPHPSTVARFDLNVWDLAKAGTANRDVAVDLVMRDGSQFMVTDRFAIDYDSADGSLWLWDGTAGAMYRTSATFNADGTLSTQWVVDKLASSTAAQPNGNYRYGVLGKWMYVDQLGAFVALDEFNLTTQDSGVWLYKPMVGAVPETATYALWLAGLVLVGGIASRRKPAARRDQALA